MLKHLSAWNVGDPGSVPGLGTSLEEEMATHSILLPGESHGWRSLVGHSPWGHKESDMTEGLHFHFRYCSTIYNSQDIEAN